MFEIFFQNFDRVLSLSDCVLSGVAVYQFSNMKQSLICAYCGCVTCGSREREENE